MATIYESKFKTTDFDANQSLMINTWTSAEMSDNDFKKEIIAWTELVEKHKPKSMIADTSNYSYVTPTEMQAWVGNEIFPRLIGAGMKRFAVILPADILKQMALEQTMEEEKTGAFQSQYFSSLNDAKAWVLKV